MHSLFEDSCNGLTVEQVHVHIYTNTKIHILIEKTENFSVGHRFYYWKYYEHLTALPTDEQMIHGQDNYHGHSGVAVSEMYVQPKHISFKEEAMCYEHLTNAQFRCAVTKATNYLKTKEAHTTRAKYTDVLDENMFLHYDIKVGDPVTLKHLLALILYTDFTKLSTAFSCSFRALKAFESLHNIKKRNATFYWMSRYLRELVEIFGKCSLGDYDENDDFVNEMNGPFYTGLDVKLFISQFAMRLNSPTSTSKQLEVAMKFGGTNGTILTFDNPKYNDQYQYLRCWDCSWLSHYKEENEVLFFGGFYRIKLICLRLLSTKQNFQNFVRCLAYLDGMITGANILSVVQTRESGVG